MILNQLTLNGTSLTSQQLLDQHDKLLADSNSPLWLVDLYDFLKSWMSESETISIQTSGSTGEPKEIIVSKQDMIISAKRTLNYFQLNSGDSILLALPVKYIAGKMIVVRALVGGLDLITVKPSNDPFSELSDNKIDFCSLVPLQIESILKNDNDPFNKVKSILIGGASLSSSAEKDLMKFSANFYESYGMAETLSHIAIRKISLEAEINFTCLPGIRVSLDEYDCIIISGKDLPVSPIITNDVGTLVTDTEFQLLGRKDDIINTGGIKVSPHSVEKKLETALKGRSFVISKEPDKEFGEKVILVIEGERLNSREQSFLENAFQKLKHFERPKKINYTPQLPRTLAGKIIRNKILSLVIKK